MLELRKFVFCEAVACSWVFVCLYLLAWPNPLLRIVLIASVLHVICSQIHHEMTLFSNKIEMFSNKIEMFSLLVFPGYLMGRLHQRPG